MSCNDADNPVFKVMRKLIAATNMTIDGFCDHTAMIERGGLEAVEKDGL